MANQFEIVTRRLGRQRWFKGLGVWGLGGLALGIGVIVLGNTLVQSRAVAITGASVGGLGLLLCVVALLGWFVVGLGVRSAISSLSAEDAVGMPVAAGEKFGGMTVLEAGPGGLHLSLGASPAAAGLGRLAACLALLAVGGLLLWVGFTSATNGRGIVAGIFVVATSAILAWVPFAMQWVVGPLPSGGPGLTVERVRFFFRRDVLQVPAEEIEGVYLSNSYLVLKLKDKRRVALVRTRGGELLDRWHKMRLISVMESILGRRLAVEED